MKPPLKPFTVEVKRSRSTTTVAKPITAAPLVLVEARPAPAPVSPSQARQAAEQIFASLTTGSHSAPEMTLTAQDLFRTVVPAVATVAKPDVELAAEKVFRGTAPRPAPMRGPAPHPPTAEPLTSKVAASARAQKSPGEKDPTFIMAESAFRTVAQPGATKEASDAQPGQKNSATQLPLSEGVASAKPTKPRVGRVQTDPAPVNKVVKSKGPAADKRAALMRPHMTIVRSMGYFKVPLAISWSCGSKV